MFTPVLLTWFFTRCVVLPFYIWKIFNIALTNQSDFMNIVYVFLFAIVVMQIYHFQWFFKLIKMFQNGSYLAKDIVKKDSKTKKNE